jgi:hypothetical protein
VIAGIPNTPSMMEADWLRRNCPSGSRSKRYSTTLRSPHCCRVPHASSNGGFLTEQPDDLDQPRRRMTSCAEASFVPADRD